MDFISHGLWAFVLIRKARFWPTVLFATFPDFIWVLLIVLDWLNYFPTKEMRVPESLVPIMGDTASISVYPQLAYTLYDIPHSFIVCGLVFLAIYVWKKKGYLFMLGWPIHIVMDIPTHTKEFFPTRFLYPVSDLAIDGIPWIIPSFLFSNITALIVVYGFYFYQRGRKKNVFHRQNG